MSTSIGNNLYPRVADFYNGKSVFITGASGFLGEVVLEVLLRLFPGIKVIYILLRPKKGVDPQERKNAIFEKALFDKLKSEQPSVFNKVQVMNGDIEQENLGLSEKDEKILIQEVTVVFHCAAIISFIKTLMCTLQINALSTYTVVMLCKRLKKCDALIYASTIYANCNYRTKIEEKVYRLPFHSQDFIDVLKEGNVEALDRLVELCQPKFPNHYTFSKCLSENIIQDFAQDLNCVISRPSAILPVWKNPLPGFAELTAGFIQLSIALGKGFIKVSLSDPHVAFDIVPVDIAAHALIVGPWFLATERFASPLVINCTSNGQFPNTNRLVFKEGFDLVKKNPVPKAFRIPSRHWHIKSALMYKLLAFYEHYIPAYVMDYTRKLKGKKPILVPLYRLLDKIHEVCYFFSSNEFDYEVKNFKFLHEGLHPADKEVLYTSWEGFNLQNYYSHIVTGNEIYDWKQDKLSKEERVKLATKHHYLSVFIQYTFIAVICLFVYGFIKLLF